MLAGKPLRVLAERRRAPLFEPAGTLHTLHPVEQDRLKHEAATLGEVFQRSSSSVEGRNGYLSLRNHRLRELDNPPTVSVRCKPRHDILATSGNLS